MSVTPRVNSVKMREYTGRTVRIIGKVLKLEGETALIEASDAGQITVKLTRDSHYADTYVEVIGKVLNDDNMLQEFTSVNMGNSIDMGMVEAVVQLSSQFPEMFPTE